MSAPNKERTFIMVKPDGVQRGLVGIILSRFEQKGYQLVGLKQLTPSQDLLKKHYADLSSKPFFPGLISYMSTGPVVAMVWQGLNVVKGGRVMLGETNPQDSKVCLLDTRSYSILFGFLVLFFHFVSNPNPNSIHPSSLARFVVTTRLRSAVTSVTVPIRLSPQT